MSQYPAVLVLGVVPSLTWLVARSICKAGGRPVVLAWHPISPLKFTADCRQYRTWGTVRKIGKRIDPSALDEVQSVCRNKKIDLVLAADYDTAVLLAGSKIQSAIPVCAMPSQGTLEAFNDKWNFTRLLKELALPCPPSEYVSSEAALSTTELVFPIITKPLDLWASVGFQIHRSRLDVERTLSAKRLAASVPLIAQSYVPGVDAGASFLADRGRLVAYSIFQHSRVGRRLFKDDMRVREYLTTFVQSTTYSGVGHIDMRYNQATDEYKILELNPRFWASLLYATVAGLNYPDLLVRMSSEQLDSVKTICPQEVKLPPYERVMTLLNRWCGQGYEGIIRAKL